MAALHIPLPDDDAAAGGADDLLSQSDRTRVVRRRMRDGSSLIVKQACTPDSLRRLRHEAAMLQRLDGVEGVSRLAGVVQAADSLALHDEGGVPLAQLLREQRLDTTRVLQIGLHLARTVAAVHRRGIVHRDINPTNILLAGRPHRPVLIDFNIASSFAAETPGFTHQSDIDGTLAYMAPEQTGRTGRTVDQRADLYSLGATLYEMATGTAPFEGDDPLQLIHDHLVRVPVAPAVLVPGLPQPLSDIVMRLLEKESDRRYQSAEGLANDLARLIERLAQGDASPWALGEHDFAARLSPPSRLIGRDAEVAALLRAFDAAVQGQSGALLVAGAPGVGKTALINELRPVATAQRGWFVSGKFDQSRRDSAASAILQAMRALGRLLLSQPEEELAELRVRLLHTLGINAGLVAGVLPEFAVLLGVAPDTAEGDPLVAEARLFQAGVGLMRSIASPARPVVMVIDDLQWAGAASVKFFDTLLADHTMRGLLLVGAYREAEVDAAHPLTPMLARWEQQGRAPSRLRLHNLPPADLGQMLQEMLRLPPQPAAELAQAVGARTEGNPFDTVELVNALRHDGALQLTEHGWQWDAAAIRRFVGQGEVVDLLSRRIERLPLPSRQLLATMACLSGEAELVLLQAATGWSADELDTRAAAPLEDGLLVMERNGVALPAIRFRHDRVQQAAYAGLSAEARQHEHLVMARRLAGMPQWAPLAAEQYLLVVDDSLSDPHECRAVVALFRDAALQAMRVNYTQGERFFAAAIALLSRVETEADQPELLMLRTHHVATLYCLGRHEDIDVVYSAIEARCQDPLLLSEAAGLRLTSLTSRGRQAEAVALGMGLLERLTPHTQAAGQTETEGWEEFARWVASLDLATDLQRPEVVDPHVLAAANLLHRVAPPAYFCGPQVLAGVAYHAQRLWATHGPCPGLMSALALSPALTIALHRDYRTGYVLSRHTLAVADARGYEPHASQLRNTVPTFAQHWFEPIENGLRALQQAREGLLSGGSLMTAAFSYSASLVLQVECAPLLDTVVAEFEVADLLGKRVGNAHASATFIAFRQLLRALRGETEAPGSFSGAGFDEAAHLAGPGAHPVPGSAYRINRALAAAVFGDHARLVEHAAAAMPLAARQGNYRAVLAHLLQALALAQRLQAGAEADAAAVLAELDACRTWLAERSADAPSNYQHLLSWVEAERAWAVGNDWLAAQRFEQALSEVARQRRPWHHALMTERCALFHLSRGLGQFGRQLMADARRAYEAWGASAKVAELLRQHAFLRPGAAAPGVRERGRSSGVSVEQIDMVAVLRASQTLSSETSLVRLQASVKQLLGTLTGATRVSLVMHGDDAQQWLMPTDDGQTLPVEQAAERGQLPLSAFRYAQRMREPLLVEDAVLDDRFADDPYFAGIERCSLLVVPILSQGELRAVLLLENRQSRGAFSAHRLDAVMLIAGQLAVSLDNAMLYASLERKVAERTEALEQANQRLEALAITDALTGLANRRHFNEVLETEWKRALRTGSSIGLAMIDVDQFKLYNDHYGHLGGDACLQRVAACIQAGRRVVGDLAARYGGEEFVLVLPNTDLAGTYTVAERLRRRVAQLLEPHAKAKHGVVTISVGITAFVPSEHSTAAHHLEAADAALYEAKHHGRNQVWGQLPEHRTSYGDLTN